jgi:hypothetical protein
VILKKDTGKWRDQTQKMAISKKVRAKIVEQASDYTYAELAQMHNCNKSSVQRIVSAANSSTAATGGGGSGSDAQQPITYESDKAMEIQPQASTSEGVHEFDVQEDPQLSSFLESIAEEEAGGKEEAQDMAATACTSRCSTHHHQWTLFRMSQAPTLPPAPLVRTSRGLPWASRCREMEKKLGGIQENSRA